MKNVIMNIKTGQGDDTHTGFDYARKMADKYQEETGNKYVVERIVDFRDRFDGEIMLALNQNKSILFSFST